MLFGTGTNILIFSGDKALAADDGVHGRELWKSDGTADGTVLVKDIVPGTGSSNPYLVAKAGGRVFLRVTAADGTLELWSTDGTELGTLRVATVTNGGSWWPPGSGGAALGDVVLFATSDPAAGNELWRSDGTEAGTYRLKDIEPGAGSSDPKWFNSFGGKVYFVAFDQAAGREIWATDGTGAGTVRVTNLAPGALSVGPEWMTVSGNALWFSGYHAVLGRELWKYVPDEPLAVTSRQVFYNNSAFDAFDPAANAADLAAVDSYKLALLPGRIVRFANVTSYTKGINGVIVEFSGDTPAPLGPDDFEFAVGASDTSARWAPAAAPSAVAALPGAGGRKRYSITWADRAVRNTWLRVTVKAGARTGLAASDVFYFGNLVGDTGGIGTPAVNLLDFARIRAASRFGSPRAGPASRYDINRDGVVNVRDVLWVKINVRHSLPLLLAPSLARGTALFGADDEESSPRRRAGYMIDGASGV